MPQFSFSDLSELTGSLGIGSIAVLGVFLILDSLTPIYSIIESIAGSKSWTLFVALPLVVMSYVAGVICVAVGHTLRQVLLPASHPPIHWNEIPESLLSLAIVEYRNLQRKVDILDGAVTSYSILAVGVTFEAIKFEVPIIGIVIGILSILSVFICALIAIRTERDFHGFIARASSK